MSVFDAHARKYDSWYERNRFAYLSEIKALKNAVPRNAEGLEIGVGTGRFALPLGIKTGIDPSEKMLKFARKRGIRAIRSEGERLPFENGQFDFVLIAITLCFVRDPKKVIAESKRVLKDKGRIIIGIIDKNSRLGRLYQAKKSVFYGSASFFSPAEIKDLLNKSGFRNIAFSQTIFGLPEKMRKAEGYKSGFGKGSFVVVRGEKPGRP